MTDNEAFEAMRKGTEAVRKLIVKAVAKEREECAAMVEFCTLPMASLGWPDGLTKLADIIRARGETCANPALVGRAHIPSDDGTTCLACGKDLQ